MNVDAMKQMVEALRGMANDLGRFESEVPAIALGLTAIEQAEKQEPVKAWCETCEGGGTVYQEHQAGCFVGGEHDCPDCDGKGFYTTPPAAAQQQWTGLTDEEIGELYRGGWANNTDFARAIEAKLKEKNA